MIGRMHRSMRGVWSGGHVKPVRAQLAALGGHARHAVCALADAKKSDGQAVHMAVPVVFL